MSRPDLHFVCLDPPWPPNYGGAIDQYYALLALTGAGMRPAVHLFHRADRPKPPPPPAELRLGDVSVYERSSNLRLAIGPSPYIVSCRKTPLLLKALAKDELPVLFQGVHATGWAARLRRDFPKRKLLLRVHNIEADYYRALAEAESSPLRRAYFMAESLRLRRYEPKVWPLFDRLFCISEREAARLSAQGLPAEWLPAFLPPLAPFPPPVIDPQAPALLFHADFTVRENQQAGDFLLRCLALFPAGARLTLAGRGLARWKPTKPLPKGACFISDPPDMRPMLEDSPVVVLPIRRGAGVKLKLLQSIQAGRIVLATPQALEGSGFESSVPVFETAEELAAIVRRLVQEPGPELARAAENAALLRALHAPERLAERIARELGH